MTPKAYVNEEGAPHLNPGEWAYLVAKAGDTVPLYLVYGCPCGTDQCSRFNSVLPINPNVQGGRAWTWDGDWEEPTISPSIKRHPCGWHGFMRKGVLEGKVER